MNNNRPLVSVICLCYNHSRFVVEAIASVLSQTYQNIELIVVDDASIDESQQVIENYLQHHPKVKFIPLSKNIGNCRAFNIGWQQASGEFIIDLAADDILYPERIAVGVACFLNAGKEYGVQFCDANIVNNAGVKIDKHLTTGFFAGDVPQGFIFADLLAHYFINPVTMMYSQELLQYLGGYDASLAYEDFDVWVRSAKKFKYCYTNQLLVAKRKLTGSHGHGQYKLARSRLLSSTVIVCQKAFALCENIVEYQALLIRLRYEMKMAAVTLNWRSALQLFALKRAVVKKISSVGF